MKYEEEFIKYIYDNYPVYNGHSLLGYMEDTIIYEAFLTHMGLEDE